MIGGLPIDPPSGWFQFHSERGWSLVPGRYSYFHTTAFREVAVDGFVESRMILGGETEACRHISGPGDELLPGNGRGVYARVRGARHLAAEVARLRVRGELACEAIVEG